MTLQRRATRTVWVEGHGLLAPDNAGGLHLLDEDFQLLRSGQNPEATAPTYAVTTWGDFAYTKDVRGAITQWDLATLRPLNSVNAANLRGGGEYLDDEEPSTVINRGICVWQDRLYVNNGYLELAVFDAATLDLVEVRPSFTDAFIEWFCTDRPGTQAVSDKKGRLFIGDLATGDFPVTVRLDDELNLHRVRYDARHDRYWVTQDAGADDGTYVSNGLVVITPDGRTLFTFTFAADDVEALEFDRDFGRAFVAGFDGEIVVFDNTGDEPRIVERISPFRHQLIDLTVTGAGDVVVLGQDGEMERLGPDGERKAQLGFASASLWDIRPDPVVDDGYLLATDTGVTAVTLVDADGSHPNLRTTAVWDHGLGFVRRVRPFRDGTYAGVARSGAAFRADRAGERVWTATMRPNLHDLDIDPDERRVLVVGKDGAVELDAESGERLRVLDTDGLVAWTCVYGPDGEAVVGTRNGVLLCYEPDATRRWRLDLGGYCKRIRALGDRMLATGGEHGAVLIDFAKGKVHGQWLEGLENTTENAVSSRGRLYTSSYGLQLGVYDEASGELRGIVEPFQDFPKAMALHRGRDRDLLLVGGRGGFVQIRDLSGDEPALLRTVYPSSGYNF